MVAPSNNQGITTRHGSRSAVVFAGVRASYEAVAFYFCWALFGVLSLGWSLIAALLDLILPRRLGGPLGRFMITRGFRMFVFLLRITGLIKCDLATLDTLRRDGPLIIAANHPGRLDAFLMLSRLPRTVCIIKARLWRNLCLGGGARLAGYIGNEAPMDMIRTSVREVRAGCSLLVFPEGTRSAGNSLGRFEGGFALIAKLSGAPVQTVFIENVSGYLGKGWPLFKRPPTPLEFRVRLGRRFEVPDNVETFVAEFEDYYRDALRVGPSSATQA